MLVFFKSQHQSELTICEAFVEVGAFLDPAKNQITVPLLRDNTAVGEVKFEMIGKNADNHGTYIVDSKHPHVLSGCKVCDQTHMAHLELLTLVTIASALGVMAAE